MLEQEKAVGPSNLEYDRAAQRASVRLGTETDLSTRSRFWFGGRIAALPLALVACLVPPAGATSGGSAAAAFVQPIDRANYSVSPRTGQSRSKFIATLRNEGASTIEYGNAYSIARRTPDGWKPLRHHWRCVFTMEARLLQPGDSASQRVGWLGRSCNFRPLEPGIYRVSKSVRYVDGITPNRSETIRARFKVT